MPNSYLVAAGAALTLSVSSVTFAYSGDLATGKPALPVMTEFDGAVAGTSGLETPVTADSGISLSSVCRNERGQVVAGRGT